MLGLNGMRKQSADVWPEESQPGPPLVQISQRLEHGEPDQTYKFVSLIGWCAIEDMWIDWEHGNEVDSLSETILLPGVLEAAA